MYSENLKELQNNDELTNNNERVNLLKFKQRNLNIIGLID